MASEGDNWPTHPDGRPKKMGEMTPEERRAQFAAAATTVRAQLEQPAMQQAMKEYLDGTVDGQAKH